MSRLKVLMLTRLFPSKAFPTLGTFCLERAKALSRHVDVRVMVPTPWFPASMPGPSEWNKWSAVELHGKLEGGLSATYPRYLSIPKIATWSQGVAMTIAIRRNFLEDFKGWNPDVIDGHFAYPDGYASVKLAKYLKRPCLVTCHGSDLRLYPELPFAGTMLRWTLKSADRVLSVSNSLRSKSIELGCNEQNAIFIPNGVDTEKFKPLNKVECRQKLNLPLDEKIGICVAALIDIKNQSLIIKALHRLRYLQLPLPYVIFLGEGPNRYRLEQEARQLCVDDRIFWVCKRPHVEVATWMAASDWLLLSSLHEGWPTVYFEAMACGRPILSTNVDSAKDAISSPDLGLVVEDYSPETFANALNKIAETDYDEDAIRRHAEAHSWSRWAEQALEVMESVVRATSA
ncbi:glycosyltransferase [Sulfuricystis multivorans]|uniref:glycosyltransferase n=1 Tax=Sulfuricystis multivorans TaxID=2211108 RepID=UPI000F83208D|nr:glycosyltransferase [Sulfuricystis multivorans]